MKNQIKKEIINDKIDYAILQIESIIDGIKNDVGKEQIALLLGIAIGQLKITKDDLDIIKKILNK